MLKNNNPYAKLSNFVWKNLLTGHKIKQIAIYAIFAITVGITSLNPIVYKWVIDKMQSNEYIYQSIWIYALVCIGLKVLNWVLYAPTYMSQRHLAFKLSSQYLVELQNRVMLFSTRWHQANHSGAIVNRIKKSYDAIKSFLLDDFMYLRTFFRFLFAIIAMIYFTPLFGTIGLILGILTIYVTASFDKRILLVLDEVNEKDHTVTSNISDNLTNYKTILSLGLVDKMTLGIKSKIQLLKGPFIKSNKIEILKWGVVESLIMLIYVIIAVGYVYQHYTPEKQFMIGGFVAVLAYSTQFTGAFQDLAWLYATLTKTYADFKSADMMRFEYHKSEDAIKNEDNHQEWNHLNISDINFSYEQQGEVKRILHNVDIDIYMGQKIALIGSSGGGKSTLLNIVKGLYESDSMKICIDNKSASKGVLKKKCSLLLQEPEIFNDTIYYNLCLGHRFSDKEIENACNLSRLNQVLEKLPEKLNTRLNQHGNNISGGECQMLSIARFILHTTNSSVLLLDEPTSNLDPVTEKSIIKNLFSYFKDKSLIMTVHRHYLLSYFDFIYIMDKGNIVWKGTYAEFCNQNEVIL